MDRYHLIIKTGTKLPSLAMVAGDYEDWMAHIAGWNSGDYRVVAVYLAEQLPAPEEVKSILITGAGAMVTDNFPWINASAEWLARAVKNQIPTLGICFGHQLLAQALGGRVDYNPNGVEVGTVPIQLTEAASGDSLFNNLSGNFRANVSHMQSALELPIGAIRLAYSEREHVHAFRYGEHTWGVQFHPEFDAEIINHYIRNYKAQLQQDGQDINALLATSTDTPESLALLKRFAQLNYK
jgi:GMP synthase (glutamine-hydrolysing)